MFFSSAVGPVLIMLLTQVLLALLVLVWSHDRRAPDGLQR